MAVYAALVFENKSTIWTAEGRQPPVPRAVLGVGAAAIRTRRFPSPHNTAAWAATTSAALLPATDVQRSPLQLAGSPMMSIIAPPSPVHREQWIDGLMLQYACERTFGEL